MTKFPEPPPVTTAPPERKIVAHLAGVPIPADTSLYLVVHYKTPIVFAEEVVPYEWFRLENYVEFLDFDNACNDPNRSRVWLKSVEDGLPVRIETSEIKRVGVYFKLPDDEEEQETGPRPQSNRKRRKSSRRR